MFKATRPDAGGSFLPADYVQARAEHRANFLTILLFLVIMFLLVSAFLITNRRWQAVRERDAAVSIAYEKEAGKIKQLHELERRQAEIAEKAEIVNALHERIGRSVLLAELNTRRPNDDVDILELELKGKRIKTQPKADPKQRRGKVRNLSSKARVSEKNQEDDRPRIEPPRFEHTLKIVGVSRDNASITDYLAALVDCPLLERVELAYIEETMLEDEDFRKFEIRARLRDRVDPRELDLARYEQLRNEVERAEGEDTADDRAGVLESIFATFSDGEE